MAKAGAIRAGRAFVELFADDSKLVRGLKLAKAKLTAFGASIRSLGQQFVVLGSAMIAPLLGATKSFAKMGDDLAKMSTRTGFSVEALSELGFAAERSGTDIGTLEKAIRKMQRSIVDAAFGLQTAEDALALLHLTVNDLAGLSPEQQFKLMANRIAGISDPTIKAAAALQLFGRGGAALLPMMVQGAAGIEALQKEFRDMGLTISTEDAKAAEIFTDKMTDLFASLKKVAFVVGSALVPILTDAANWIIKTAGISAKWIKQNKGLIVSVFKLGVVIIGVGAALVTFGIVIAGIAKAIGIAIVAVSGFHFVLSGIVAVIGFMLTPIGLVTAGIISLAVIVLSSSNEIRRVLKWLGDKFVILGDDAAAAFQGIKDALAAGDLALAAEIFWLTLKVEWQRGIGFLEEKWIDFTGFFKKIFINAVDAVKAGVEELAATISFQKERLDAANKQDVLKLGGFGAAVASFAKERFDLSKILALELTGIITPDTANKLRALRKKHGFEERKFFKEQTTTDIELANRNLTAELKRINEDHEAKMAAIGQVNLDENEALNKEQADKREKAIAENAAALAKVQAEWAAAIEKARQGKQDGDKPLDTELGNIQDLLRNIRKGAGELDDLLGKQDRRQGVSGAFNLAAAFGLSGRGGPEERTARATEQLIVENRRIQDQLRRIRIPHFK